MLILLKVGLAETHVRWSLLLLDEFPGHVQTVDLNPPPVVEEPDLGSRPLEANDATIIEKSNVLLLGPSGVGKTYSAYHLPNLSVDRISITLQ